MKNNENKLNTIKQSRDRQPMPRPTVFKNKTKYDRKRLDDLGDDEWWFDEEGEDDDR